jgi:uncharacterized membrane protein YbhN (UPF0104 family)
MTSSLKLQSGNYRWKTSLTLARRVGTFLILCLSAWYVYAHRQDLKIILTVSWTSVAWLLLASVLNTLSNAAQCVCVYKALGAPMKIWESFHLSNLSSAVGLFVSQGTTITKTIYLKSRYQVPFSKAPAIYLGLLVVFFIIGAMMITAHISFAALRGIEVPFIYWLVLAGAAISLILLKMDVPLLAKWLPGRAGKMVSLFAEGWKCIRGNRSCLVMACVCQVFIFVTAGLRIYLAYRAMGLEINPISAVSVAVFVHFSGLLMLTPGNLGVQEAVYGYLTVTEGMSFANGVAVSALIRGVDLVATAFLAPIAWYILFYRRGIHISRSEISAVHEEGAAK